MKGIEIVSVDNAVLYDLRFEWKKVWELQLIMIGHNTHFIKIYIYKKERRKWYWKITIEELKRCAICDKLYATIDNDNIASLNLFKWCWFKEVNNIEWLREKGKISKNQVRYEYVR